MITTTPCPAVDDLRRYSIGEYSDEEGDRIEAHLAECAACEESLSRFDDTGDSLVRHLPLTGRREQDRDETGWLERLMTYPPRDEMITDDDEHVLPNADDAGNCFGAYELSGVLGKGGMGVVYAARHRQLGRPVAIKVVDPKLVAAHEARRRFDREIRVLGALDHPGIVSATDAGRIAGAAYLVMERIDGLDLASVVRKTGPLSIPEACEITRQVASALAAAHEAGAVHRDVKPSNVMIDRTGRVKLLDFGLAHLAGSIGGRRETTLGRLLGTLDYMAPEQAEGEQTGPAADLYGLGATLFFLLTARPPKITDREQTLVKQLRALTKDSAPRLDELRSGVPAELNDLVARLLDSDPRNRPNSAAEVAAELAEWNDEASTELLRELATSVEAPKGEDGGAVVRSLSELLGDDAAGNLHSPAVNDSGRDRKWWRFGALLIAFAVLICFGIVVLIQTDEGTVRIESEVAGVTVELLDEKDRVRRLEIENKEGETHLRAGRYRVRLARDHDRLSVEPSSIVLSKNETELARVIVKRRSEDQDTASHGPSDGPDARLYQGLSEAVWQRRFDSETNPVAKIEAAKALITLAAGLPPRKQVERIVAVSAELVRAGWGEHPDDYLGYHSPSGPDPVSPRRWSTSAYRTLPESWSAYLQQAQAICGSLEPLPVVQTLTTVIEQSPGAQAVFATPMLAVLKRRIVDRGPEACDVVLTLQLAENDPLRLHLCIVQAEFYPSGSPDARRTYVDTCTAVAERVIDDNMAKDNYRAVREWFQQCQQHEITLPDTIKARVAQSMLLAQPRQASDDVFQAKWMADGSMPYPDKWMTQAREEEGAIWDAWLPHLNRWLATHPEPSETSRLMLSTLNVQLRVRKESDDWPVETLVRLLSERVERSGGSGSSAEGESMHDLLSYIVLAGGDLPEKTRAVIQSDEETWPPLVREIADQRRRREDGLDVTKAMLEEHEGLLLDHPASTVAMLLRDEWRQEIQGVRPATLHAELIWLSGRGDSDDSPPPIEPLLLLAIATELTGESEARDDRIASRLFATWLQSRSRIFHRHIEDALAYPFAIREVAEKWLRRMRERAVSDLLVTAIDELLPGDARDRAEFIKENPESLLAVLARYNEETRESRENRFEPPIADLMIDQLIAAFRSGAATYRKLGQHAIADALQESARRNRLADRLTFHGVSGTSAKSEDGEPSFRQIIPALRYETGPSSSTVVVLSDIELRWSRDGWSSLDWGDIHAPLTGRWQLRSVAADKEELDGEAFKRWSRDHQPWTRIVIEDNRRFILAGDEPHGAYDLQLDYSDSTPAEFRLLQSGSVEYRGYFMNNASIDDTELRLTLDVDSGPRPEAGRTKEDTDAVTLRYRRSAVDENSQDRRASNAEQPR